jgi:outer membrane protein, heavy metal efflux system
MRLLAAGLLAVFGIEGEARAADVPAEPIIPNGLTLAQAVALFRAHGLDLIIAEATVEEAAGDVQAANAIPNPSVTGGWLHSFTNAIPVHNGWFAGVGDSNAIEDTLSGKRGLRRGVAAAAFAAARLQRADAQRSLELQVKQQYFQTVGAAAGLEFARETQMAAARTFELNQVRYKAGAISEVDLARTETAKLEAEQAVDQAVAALREAKVSLAFLLGRRQPFTDFTIDARQFRYETPAALTNVTAQDLLSRALAARPDLRGQEAQRERAGRSLALAKRQRFPDIGVSADYTQEGSPFDANAITPPTLQLGLTATLPLFYQQQGEIHKAEADVRGQDAASAKIRAQVVSDVENAFSGYQSSRRLVERMQGRLIDRARRGRDLVRLQYEKGAASLLEYLDAERTYVSTELEYIQDLTSYWNAVFALEAATATEIVP